MFTRRPTTRISGLPAGSDRDPVEVAMVGVGVVFLITIFLIRSLLPTSNATGQAGGPEFLEVLEGPGTPRLTVDEGDRLETDHDLRVNPQEAASSDENEDHSASPFRVLARVMTPSAHPAGTDDASAARQEAFILLAVDPDRVWMCELQRLLHIIVPAGLIVHDRHCGGR